MCLIIEYSGTIRVRKNIQTEMDPSGDWQHGQEGDGQVTLREQIKHKTGHVSPQTRGNANEKLE